MDVRGLDLLCRLCHDTHEKQRQDIIHLPFSLFFSPSDGAETFSSSLPPLIWQDIVAFCLSQYSGKEIIQNTTYKLWFVLIVQ